MIDRDSRIKKAWNDEEPSDSDEEEQDEKPK